MPLPTAAAAMVALAVPLAVPLLSTSRLAVLLLVLCVRLRVFVRRALPAASRTPTYHVALRYVPGPRGVPVVLVLLVLLLLLVHLLLGAHVVVRLLLLRWLLLLAAKAAHAVLALHAVPLRLARPRQLLLLLLLGRYGRRRRGGGRRSHGALQGASEEPRANACHGSRRCGLRAAHARASLALVLRLPRTNVRVQRRLAHCQVELLAVRSASPAPPAASRTRRPAHTPPAPPSPGPASPASAAPAAATTPPCPRLVLRRAEGPLVVCAGVLLHGVRIASHAPHLHIFHV